MKRKLKLQVYIQLYLMVCMLIGVFFSKTAIEESGLSFWLVFVVTTLGLAMISFLSLGIKWYILRKRVNVFPDADERTLENVKTSLLWSYVGTIIIVSIGIFLLFFINIKAIEIEWLVYGLIIVWMVLIGSLFIGQKM